MVVLLGDITVVDVLIFFQSLIAPIVILWAIITNDKYIGAMIQMGSLQRREQDMHHYSGLAGVPEQKQSQQSQSKKDVKRTPRTVISDPSPPPSLPSPSPPVSKSIGRIEERYDAPKPDKLKGTNLSGEQTTLSKLVFTGSIVNIGMTCYVLGASPKSFYILFSIKIISLLTFRTLAFLKEGKQWLMVDFCYWVNVLFLYYVWVDPGNAKLFQVLYMCSNGPLAWAMLAFSHSMILHSWQHVASVVIHASPMLMSFGVRWFSEAGERFAVCQPHQYEGEWQAGSQCHVGQVTLVWQAVTNFYIWWLVLYYTIVMYLMSEYLHSNGFQTLFDRVTTKGPMKKFLRKYMETPEGKETYTGNFLAKAVYLCVHFVYGMVTMFLISSYFNNFYFHFFHCFLLTGVTSWNGAGFYFTAFGRDERGKRLAKIARKASLSTIPLSPPQLPPHHNLHRMKTM